MSRLEQIQDEIAIEKGYKDFDDLLESIYEMEIIKAYFRKSAIRYAIESCKASLTKASNNLELTLNQRCTDWIEQQDKINCEDNIVLL
ncbi:hypothetical protein KBP46_10005 [Chryseobacterium sp. PCH239]|uniref:hypothetical protein n=1 Tax=Chryseobacterium sp. PCH239 TaxID=2825845 RepID=UPI001C0FE40F|nr:hypothetical protein [Chryseobacterium sp. PCH239]QWT88129.1 hypothetical protein KBP46_10005 [Chryseobacterium sp. PCH239]